MRLTLPVCALLALMWFPATLGVDNSPSAAGRDLCENSANFRCDPEGSQCVFANATCDGISHCANGRDESVETCGCLPSEFQCNQTTCISKLKQCDTFRDCSDGLDEQNCESHSCYESSFRCDNYFCIPLDKHCDFHDDCGDNSDEGDKCAYKKCFVLEFTCQNKQCVLFHQLCDGQADCVDGSDESQEACDMAFPCEIGHNTIKDYVCDGWADCMLTMSDEVNCSRCDFKCPNGRCVDSSNVCDGVCDCLSCRDELNCTSWTYACSAAGRNLCRKSEEHDPRCIRSDQFCNEQNDCKVATNYDESSCGATSPCSDGKFFCGEGRCLESQFRCDFVRDCAGGEDEAGCNMTTPCSNDEFRCAGGQCIPINRRCDLRRDCLDWTDEVGCDDIECSANERRCDSGQCVPEEYWCDYHPDCPDVSDEGYCEYHNSKQPCTAEQFTCNSGQCIDKSQVCFRDRDMSQMRLGCNDNSHLVNCSNHECQSEDMYKCPRSFCIYKSRVCDSEPDCIQSLQDEDGCENPCAAGEVCRCKDQTMNCESLGLTDIPAFNLLKEHSTKILLKNNLIQLNTIRMKKHDINFVTYLDLSNNSLTEVPSGCFDTLLYLTYLSLSNNGLTTLKSDMFSVPTRLTQLHLSGNKIHTIEPGTFETLNYLTALDLRNQELTYVYKNMFKGLKRITILNLFGNKIRRIDDGAFNGLIKLVLLDLSENQINKMGQKVFMGLPQLKTVKTDAYRFCCLVQGHVTCSPEPDVFSSCEDLMSNHVLRISIWVLGIVALLGNFVVVFWRFLDFSGARVHSFLITNLAIGDFLMGVYLVIIAVVDTHYRGVYSIYSDQWRHSRLCKFAGFISTFSSELSVLTLTTITLDRLMCILFPLKRIKLGLKQAVIVMSLMWIFVFFLALVPLLGFQYFGNFYGRSGVCLALPVTPDRPAGWEFSVAVFLVLNLVSFMVIACSYIRMFCVAKKTRSAVRTAERQNDAAMARRMTVIVMTDFFCWIPIIALGIASLAGVRVDNQIYAWIAVFILPLNSATNPVLYTLSTAPFLGNVRKRATRFRKSFVMSFNAESKHSYVEDRTSHSFCERKSAYRELELIRLRSMNGSPTPLYCREDNRAT